MRHDHVEAGSLRTSGLTEVKGSWALAVPGASIIVTSAAGIGLAAAGL
jgi:hypothetical protein